ncbi:MAG: PEP-CTERM sorting domain-containing protein [Acidobacteriaceae bacterium]|nr:PEP-CTERM sorting domain-containing protein [Acidobacteriaceae bacterium]MBV9296295.1 PEP-CTERM sorting domain-containing protein [Acidobacteriaceae bacterium]MBV9763884.1 PEP-CTERM sorting domain-containing protein [Acidobacteriaceae bacterium]
MKMRILSGALLFTGTVLIGVPAGATNIGNGMSGPPDVLTETGTLLASTGVLPFSTATYSGTYEAAVYKEAGGTLDFLYQIQNNSSSSDSIDRATAASFKGFTTDVGYDPTFNLPGFTGTVKPDTVDKSSTGTTVGWNTVPPGIDPGTTSYVLQIDTNATAFMAGTFSMIDSRTFDGVGYQPTVPEPASLALIGVGLLGLAALRKRRSSNK